MLKRFLSEFEKILHFIRLFGAYTIQLFGRISLIDNNMILLYSFERKGLCCNPKYIIKKLAESKNDYKLYWISKWPETVERSKDYSIVKLRSVHFYLLCSRARYIITNDRFDDTVLKRKGQIYINTWHGGGIFKKAGFDAVRNAEEEKLIADFYHNMDYYLVSNMKLAGYFESAFRIKPKQILPFGMPRSDIFFNDLNISYKKVRDRYSLHQDIKIVLYAPTYRDDHNLTYLFPDNKVEALLQNLSKRFGGEWVFAYKSHYFECIPEHISFSKVINCEDYYDTQELLCGIDVLITDYSSLLWDFSLLNRTAFRYAQDLKRYEKKERPFYLEYSKWPYPYATNVEELFKQIREYNEEKYMEDNDLFLKETGNYDDGKASERFVKWIEMYSHGKEN